MNIINNCYIENNSSIAKYIIENIFNLKELLFNYQDFVADKYLYDKLAFQEKEYISPKKEPAALHGWS